MHIKRIIIVPTVGFLVPLVLAAAVAWPQNCRMKLHSLSIEPSGLYDQAGAELPFVSVSLSVPELENPEVELAHQPVKVQCRVNNRWTAVPNRSVLSAATDGEISFLVFPGTEVCRLRIPCRREVPGARIVKYILPSARFWSAYPRFSAWVCQRSPFGPTLLRLYHRRNQFDRPVYDSEVTAEILMPSHSRFLAPPAESAGDSFSTSVHTFSRP